MEPVSAYPGNSVATNPASPYYKDARNGNVAVNTSNFSQGGYIYGDVGTNGGNGEASASAHPADKQRLAFEAFNHDLTDYLNSSDYTHEFIRDSLRQGNYFCHECITVTKGDAFEVLRSRQQQLIELCEHAIAASPADV